MHRPPPKPAIRSGSSVHKKLSFATFQNYEACRGYRYPATQNCIETASIAGYDPPSRERVVIHPPSPVELQWMMASPPITFGIVQPLPGLSSPRSICPPSSPGSECGVMASSNLNSLVSSPSVSDVTLGLSPARLPWPNFNARHVRPIGLGPDSPIIPSSQEANENF